MGAAAMPSLGRKIGVEWLAVAASLVFGGTMVVMTLSRNLPLIVVWLTGAGCAWTTTMSTMNTGVQLSVPPWVQAHTLGAYQMIFAGGMGAGSALWGALANHTTSKDSLLVAAAGIVETIPIVKHLPLLRGAPPDLNPFAVNRPAPW